MSAASSTVSAAQIKAWTRSLRKPPIKHIKSIRNLWTWNPAQPDNPAPPPQPAWDWIGKNVLTAPKDQTHWSACSSFAVSTTIEASMRIANPGDQRIVDPGFLHSCIANKLPTQGVDLTPLVQGTHVGGFTCSPPNAPFPYPPQSCPTAQRVPLHTAIIVPGPNAAKFALLQRPIVSEMWVWADFAQQLNVQTYNSNQAGSVFAHSVCVIGFTPAGWLIQNSFGPHWGINGQILIPYGTCGLFSPAPAGMLDTDAWSITL